jgi:hypothetical protein
MAKHIIKQSGDADLEVTAWRDFLLIRDTGDNEAIGLDREGAKALRKILKEFLERGE